jgi:hypothetical protein
MLTDGEVDKAAPGVDGLVVTVGGLQG